MHEALIDWYGLDTAKAGKFTTPKTLRDYGSYMADKFTVGPLKVAWAHRIADPPLGSKSEMVQSMVERFLIQHVAVAGGA